MRVKPIDKWVKSMVVVSFYLCALLPSYLSAQTGTWHAYTSYYEPQQIIKGGNKLYVRASNSLYTYNTVDQSITTFDKVRQLNDTYITIIAWNQQVKRLIVVYKNSNIDLIDAADNVVNIGALYSKSMTQDKTVNSVYIYQQYAYLATGFGVVKVNMQRAEISESYILNENISAVGISDGQLYAKKSNGEVMAGQLTTNLIDPHNWSGAAAPSGLFDNDLTDWNDNIDLVRTLQPGGPKYNNFGFMRLKNGTLYTCGGGYETTVDLKRPATIQLLKDGEWTMLDDNLDDIAQREGRNWTFIDMMSVDVDPSDEKHIYGGGRPGLFEYYDGKLINYFNKDNSILQNATVSTSNKYILVESIMYDREGNLWMLQSQTLGNSIVQLSKDSVWSSLPQSELMADGQSLGALRYLFEDSRGLIWFVNNHWQNTGIFCYDPTTDRLVHTINTIVNQDGLSYLLYTPYCFAEDLDGSIWVGTNIGPFLMEADRIGTSDNYLTQVKVPRNDGTNYADYLMSGGVVNCIAIDGGGRKWMGTKGSGVYLISADNMEQLEHFTTSNSPLLSDIIESLVINNETGELFIGTENGLCSYMTDASTASIEMTKNNVYAYPNPVVSGYDGLITVVGLTLDADVKILSTSGQLVAQGRSNGGTFTWNGRDRQGRRVASGVYMVATATSDGKKGTVCKIAVVR